MCTYYTASQGGCPQSTDRGASVGQSPAINRLLEFIIVSSYDGEEPRGLGERERMADQAASLSVGFYFPPCIDSCLSFTVLDPRRYLSQAGRAGIHVFFFLN